MLVSTAKRLTGGLSRTSKMPCPSWSTPPSMCKTGALYSTYKNSVCSSCYAKKGRSAYPRTGRARENRLAKWKLMDAANHNTKWVLAMVTLIHKHKHFRWFDAGDLYSERMLIDIFAICRATPGTQHWLPTLERAFVLHNKQHIPDNLCIRFSSPIIDQASSSYTFPISKVSTQGDVNCPATSIRSTCEDCRKCWDKNEPIITYRKH